MATETLLGISANPSRWKRVHLFAAASCAFLLGACSIGSWIAGDSGWKGIPLAAAAVLPISFFPAILRHDRKEFDEREAALTIPWLIALTVLVPWFAILSARLGLPLRDSAYASIDRHLGFNLPWLLASIRSYPRIDGALSHSYSLLSPLLIAAMAVPPILGKREAAERFLVSNIVAFLASIPLFTLFPAVGPWVGYGFSAVSVQKNVEDSIQAIRSGHTAIAAAIVCFPSFHVIWAALSAVALWSLKPLRILACTVALLVVISTVTTGWHYVCDVLAGILLAGASIVLANRIIQTAPSLAQSRRPSAFTN